MKIKSIAVFCGAHLGNDPIYEEKAKEISQLIASKGINVVFGGGDVGGGQMKRPLWLIYVEEILP